ncbi:MAG TPA: DUF6526 family protein [Bryobacteraceae bacterium]|nr:DUF6526 family protein [Bryobacteraceae bacterium]
MERKPQTLANHTKFDPMFHFFLGPVALAAVIYTIWNAVQNPGTSAYLHILAAIWATVLVFKMRLYSLKVQDRVIRLEERLRLANLLTEPLKSKAASLTESQLIGLRFASDAELPALVEKTLADNLNSKAIKQAVKNWRPDYWRV